MLWGCFVLSRTAYVLSAFDLVNGHDVDFVRQASEHAERVEARVLPDEIVREATGQSPVVPMAERLEIIGSMRRVSGAAVFDPRYSLKRNPRDVVFARGEVGAARARVDRWLTPQAVRLDDWAATPPNTPGGVTGYVPGAWDLFHIGHLNILKRARQQCDRLIAGVVTDEELVAVKGRLPAVPLAERLQVVGAMDIVDAAVVDFSTSKLDVWRRVHFDVLFKGDDWRGTAKGDRLEAEMASVGASVRYFPYTAHTSSTALRQILAGR